jgi:hypothetical protein
MQFVQNWALPQVGVIHELPLLVVTLLLFSCLFFTFAMAIGEIIHFIAQ